MRQFVRSAVALAAVAAFSAGAQAQHRSEDAGHLACEPDALRGLPVLRRPSEQGLRVYGFGGCQLTNYTASASVGDLPRVSVAFVADNMSFYASGSGVTIPAVNAKDFTNCNLKFALPSPYEGLALPSTLLPGDILVDIKVQPQLTGIDAIFSGAYSPVGFTSYYNNPVDIGIPLTFSNLGTQSYQISLDLSRIDVTSMGYKLPIDRVIQFPLICTNKYKCIGG